MKVVYGSRPGEEPSHVRRVRSALYDTLGPLLDRSRPMALLDFPDHGNVGDSAIWLGERKIIQSLGIELAYTASISTFDERSLRRAIGHNGLILMHGGGNFGDLWPAYQRFREEVIERFPSNRIICLPQTIQFDSMENLRLARSRMNPHRDLVVLARDHRSLDVGRQVVDGDVQLCPDAAFALTLQRMGAPDLETLWLLRDDKEAAPWTGELVRSPEVDLQDWPRDPFGVRGSSRATRSAQWRWRRVQRAAVKIAASRRLTAPLSQRRFDRLASQRLEGGVALISRARAVVTDRLHGHIICLLAGIPHVLADNSYGKVTDFATTWATYDAESGAPQDLDATNRVVADLLAADLE